MDSDYFLKSIIKKLIPRQLRRLIRLELYRVYSLIPKIYKIKPYLINEWQLYYSKRSSNKIDFIIFGITSFDYRVQRPQHLAYEMAKLGHRVFYIENEFIFNILPLYKGAPFKVKKILKNIYVVNLAAKKDLFIYKDIPTKRDKEILISSIKNLISNAKLINPIAKIDHPFWAEIVNELGMPIIYDCMDEHSGFKENSGRMKELERETLLKSCGVIVSSKLLEKKVRNNRINNILMLKNAGDFYHFNNINKRKFKVPEDISGIKKPIIGYYGAISDWLDLNILEKIAGNYSYCSIVLIGRVGNSSLYKLTRKYKNIYLLGEKPYSILPDYLEQFDVCTIPFIINDLIKATDPVKIYEYFAAGKPVVTTAIPQLDEFRDILYMANNANSFSDKIGIALEENNKGLKNKRIEIAKRNTWEERGKVLNKWVNKILFPKASIVIVSYNNPEIIKGCIKSVLERSFYPNFEIIVVDNASNKKTQNVLDSLEKDKRIRVIRNKQNYGFAKGNNIGLHRAIGEYIILLNNDTLITPGWISRLIYHANKKDVGLVGPVTNNIGNEAKIDIKYNPRNRKDMEDEACKYIYSHWGKTMELKNIAAFCWIMSKATYKKIGDFDEIFGKGLFEDDDYCMRIRKQGLRILVADDAYVHHWGGSSTKWESIEYRKLLEKNRKKFEDKWKIKWTPHKYREF